MPYVRDSLLAGPGVHLAWRRCRPRRERWSAEVAGRRPCRPLDGAAPAAVFAAVEKDALRPLPARAVRAGDVGDGRRSARTSTPRSDKVLYSVPWRLIGKTADVRLDRDDGPVLHRRAAGQDPPAQGPRQADRLRALPAGEDRLPHADPGLVPQAGRRDRPGVRAGHRRAAGRQRAVPAARRPGRDRPGRQARPARLEAACAKAIDRRGPVLPHHQGHPGRRRRSATRCPQPPGTAAPRRSCTARRRSPTSSRCPARSPATPCTPASARARPHHDRRPDERDCIRHRAAGRRWPPRPRAAPPPTCIEQARIPGLSADRRRRADRHPGARAPGRRPARPRRRGRPARSRRRRPARPATPGPADPAAGSRADGQFAGHPVRIFTPVTEDTAIMTTVTVTDRSALAAALRDLKLSGMLDTLDARLAQARAGELGHLDFLQVLCQDEISRRETTSLARRIRRARFETAGHPGRIRLRRLPETARRPDPRPRRAALAARRRVGHPLRPGRGRQEPRRPGPRPPRHPPRRRGPLPQDQPGPGRPGRRPRRPHLGQAAPRAHPPRRPHPRRLRHARAHRRPGRRPLRADHRTSRQIH